MDLNLNKKLRILYNKTTNSIAFYPAIIAVGFLLLSWIMLEIDFSETGKSIKKDMSWLSLKDADTARSIISTIAAAIISLTVFSFSMVMIVLNQAASQMSNRVLSSMIGNRFQQTVLGFYIGTIVYALFLLSTIRDITSGVYVPALSIYLLILLTVVDIFLFIYFLDYVTQTVKYETVIDRVQTQTMNVMRQNFKEEKPNLSSWDKLPFVEIKLERSGYFQSVNVKNLLKIGEENDLQFQFLHDRGTFLLGNLNLLKVYNTNRLEKELIDEILSEIDFFNGQPIDKNVVYGFKQLSEIAIKALSPGINDPGTAVIALQSLFDLFSFNLTYFCPQVFTDKQSYPRIFIPFISFSELFSTCIYPIWNYGKEDQYIQNELSKLIIQIKFLDVDCCYTDLFNDLLGKIENQKKLQK